MKALICERCGAGEFNVTGNYRECVYCGTKYQLSKKDKSPPKSSIALDDDIELLLEKCRKDPAKAPKYAKLILDIDPANSEARRYI